MDTLKNFPPEISDERKLKDNIIDQAKYFLSNAGKFFPFGAITNFKDEIAPLGVQLKDYNPESPEVLELLERAIDLKLVPYRSPKQWQELIRIASRKKRSAATSVSVDSFCEGMIDE